MIFATRSSLFFLLIFASSTWAEDRCVSALITDPRASTLSLERAYPGIGQELYATLDTFNDPVRTNNIDDVYEFHKKLSQLGDKVAPKGKWLSKVEEKARKLDEMFLSGQITLAKFRQNLAGLIYEAAVATQIPSDDIYIGEDLPVIARKHQITRTSGKKAESIPKEIDLAWYQGDTLFLLEAKNIGPFFIARKTLLERGALVDEIIEQSKRLKRALKAYDVKVTTILTVRNLNPDLKRQIVAGGAAYDHIVVFNPREADPLTASER